MNEWVFGVFAFVSILLCGRVDECIVSCVNSLCFDAHVYSNHSIVVATNVNFILYYDRLTMDFPYIYSK